MLDVENGVRGDANTLARDLDAEVLSLLERVGEAAQLGDELFERIAFLEVALGVGQREIAAALCLPETTIETRIARARRMLREQIAREEATSGRSSVQRDRP